MEKLLVICGPTATGKTALALALAKKFDGELVNADSRQMYEGLNILTGKDLPSNAVSTHRFSMLHHDTALDVVTYMISGIPVWLYDIAKGQTPLSISAYRYAANVAIEDIRKRGKLPILVGGSGLYIQSVCEHISTIDIPQDLHLRSELAMLTVSQLQQKLKRVAPYKLSAMNVSDKSNPRRLIRAIEVGMVKHNVIPKEDTTSVPQDILWIGLLRSKKSLSQSIIARVAKRWEDGAVAEVGQLSSLDASSPYISSLGIDAISQYLRGDLSEGDAQKLWATQELAYAKRQMTWFQKRKDIQWFEIEKSDIKKAIEKLVGAWYTKK